MGAAGVCRPTCLALDSCSLVFIPGLQRTPRLLLARLETEDDRIQRLPSCTLKVLVRRPVEPQLIFRTRLECHGQHAGLAIIGPVRPLSVRDGGEFRTATSPGETLSHGDAEADAQLSLPWTDIPRAIGRIEADNLRGTGLELQLFARPLPALRAGDLSPPLVGPCPGCASVSVTSPRPVNNMIAGAGQRFVFLNFAIMRILSFSWFLSSRIPARLGAQAEQPKPTSSLMMVRPYGRLSSSFAYQSANASHAISRSTS